MFLMGLGALLVLGGFLYLARSAIWRGPLSGPESPRPVRDTLEPPRRSMRFLESVRRLQAGLQSFLSMRRIEARRKNASAFRLRFSQSLASLRQRLSQAMVRSTIQRLGKTTNPLT